MRKRYEVRGMMEWHSMFMAGRARIRVSFTGGHIGDGCSTPAVFETSDDVLQRVIENSPAFLSGRIRVGAFFPDPPVTGVPTTGKVKAHRSAPQKCDLHERQTMVFDTVNDAAEYLHTNKEISMSRLIEAEDCKAEALRLGINLVIKKEK